jgi:hypothetical protein
MSKNLMEKMIFLMDFEALEGIAGLLNHGPQGCRRRLWGGFEISDFTFQGRDQQAPMNERVNIVRASPNSSPELTAFSKS